MTTPLGRVGTRRQSTRDVRARSRFAILRGIYLLGTPTRHELVSFTGLSFATVSNVVTELISVDMVVEAEREQSNGGRPRSRLQVAAGRGVLIGVDVAETYVHVDAFDLALNRLSRHGRELTDRSDPAWVVGEIVGCVQEAIVANPREVFGVGVSLPGQVEPTAGVSVFAPNWHWRDVPVRQMLTSRLPVPVNVDNPLKATTVAELWFGAGRSVSDLITVTLGTGVGAGIALDGELVRGVTNNAGEWGHTTLVMDGRSCRCGRRGCVETYIGVPGLMTTFAERFPDHRYVAEDQQGFVRSIRAGLQAGEPEAAWLIEVFSHALGESLTNLVNLFNPERVILTSWTAAELGPWLLAPTQSRMAAQSIGGSATAVQLSITEIGDNPVGLGMATLALERHLDRVGLPAGRRPHSAHHG